MLMPAEIEFKLTYSTMFNPPEALHTHFDKSLTEVYPRLGREHGMLIDGKEVLLAAKFEVRSPADTQVVLGAFQKGGEREADAAVAAAKKTFPFWRSKPWQERVRILRKAVDLIDERIFEIGVVLALEVGKNRMEALGDIAESVDLIRYCCDRMEACDGFVVEMGRDPLSGLDSRNVSVMCPYGVWLVISPFNYPAALAAGPAGAALVTGNTVVIKPASDTPWTARLIVECLHEAGLPAGAANYVTGPGKSLGQALIDHPDVSGITFTGSKDVGMAIYRNSAMRSWVQATIIELGGKNPAIVSRHADLDIAARGIIRSAFGLQGQKCSACSRVLVEAPVYNDLVERLIPLTEELVIGDPTDRSVYLGPVINDGAYANFQRYIDELAQGGTFVTGGKILKEGALGRGYFCAPTFAADVPLNHRLWKNEMFLPIVFLARVASLDEAMAIANDVDYGLTAGFYGNDTEIEWFFEHIQAGVVYVNRPLGATTGAWPGFQPFGGWKGSDASGKNAGGLYYLPLYMREQVRNLVRQT
jgi:1-pyrroline-5-carboxylate dehydrogenase